MLLNLIHSLIHLICGSGSLRSHIVFHVTFTKLWHLQSGIHDDFGATREKYRTDDGSGQLAEDSTSDILLPKVVMLNLLANTCQLKGYYYSSGVMFMST